MMQEDQKGGTPPSPRGDGVTFHFACEDFDTAYKEFKSRGVKACRPLVGNGLKYTIVTDPDGYRLFFESRSGEPTSSSFEEIFDDG
jgi:hypothetical protein